MFQESLQIHESRPATPNKEVRVVRLLEEASAKAIQSCKDKLAVANQLVRGWKPELSESQRIVQSQNLKFSDQDHPEWGEFSRYDLVQRIKSIKEKSKVISRVISDGLGKDEADTIAGRVGSDSYLSLVNDFLRIELRPFLTSEEYVGLGFFLELSRDDVPFLEKINLLMHSPQFLDEIALATNEDFQNRAQVKGSSARDETPGILTSQERSESLAGFIAFQEGLGILVSKKQLEPQEIMERVLTGKLENDDRYLFNLLSFLTWYKNQIWLGRIDRPEVRAFDFKTNQEAHTQDWPFTVVATQKTADWLGLVLDQAENSEYFNGESSDLSKNNVPFLQRVTMVMRDSALLTKIALACDGDYRRKAKERGQTDDYLNQPLINAHDIEYLTMFDKVLATAEEDDKKEEIKKDEKWKQLNELRARGTSPMVAIIGALSYLANTDGPDGHNRDPIDTLKRVITGEWSPAEQDIFARFAHAFWYQDQPWRGRELRDMVAPFDLLEDDVKQLDLDQVQAAAKVILPYLETNSQRP